MAGTLPHAIHIGMCQFNGEEEDARQDKEETHTVEEDRGNAQNKHAQAEAVQLPEAYKSRSDPRLPEDTSDIILSQSRSIEISRVTL